MARFALVLTASVAALAGCAAPPTAELDATLRAGHATYELDGRIQLGAAGYRVCGTLDRAPAGFLAGRTLWLERRDADYGTLTAGSCRRSALWFDDHPPTLELPGRRVGGEDLLHAALVALGAVGRLPALAPGTHTDAIDFAALDTDPPRRDEDGWTMRPLLRSLGRHPVTVRVNEDGVVDRLVLVARGALVELRLSRFGGVPRVPPAVALAIE
jgi:hypothetical protein